MSNQHRQERGSPEIIRRAADALARTGVAAVDLALPGTTRFETRMTLLTTTPDSRKAAARRGDIPIGVTRRLIDQGYMDPPIIPTTRDSS